MCTFAKEFDCVPANAFMRDAELQLRWLTDDRDITHKAV